MVLVRAGAGTPPEPEPPPEALPQPPQVSEAAPAEPEPLSAEWLRDRLGAYRDAAIDDPTPGSVALYLYLQRQVSSPILRIAPRIQIRRFA